MFRSMITHKLVRSVLALAFVLALAATAACTSPRTPVSAPSSQAEPLPVTGAKVNSAPSAQKVDPNASGGQQVAADRMYLESDAWLVKGVNGWQVVTHSNLAPSKVQSPAVDRIYLESDYWLVYEAGAWRVVPPSSQVRLQPQIPVGTRIYLESDTWLVRGEDGWKIVQNVSK